MIPTLSQVTPVEWEINHSEWRRRIEVMHLLLKRLVSLSLRAYKTE
jgi:hypothetical protein